MGQDPWTRDLGTLGPGTRDLPQSLKVEPGTPPPPFLKFKSGTQGPPSKFKIGPQDSLQSLKVGPPHLSLMNLFFQNI